MHPSCEETVEQLTHQAMRAAEEGRWDAVERHYRARADFVRSSDIPASLARRIHFLDRLVFEKLRIATLAAKGVLTEVVLKRRLLERFGHKSDASPDLSRRVSRRV